MRKVVILVAAIVLCTLLGGCSFKKSDHTAGNVDAQRRRELDALKDPQWLAAEAHKLIESGDYLAAIEKAELAVSKDPNVAYAQHCLALAYCDSGRPNDALTHAKKA